ncbi:MAG: UDP-4-amino-4,6-dideoxy-N-acetyl-beta-L-altrosamine transaminase [Candidatus Taylorbacteria bacterium]|nr:UDP-4-amino-4,6-dideoxy-N-acetyl-beta-L-altrosamine transaminase [Candidatus Taylorbacteria bacterium]
MIHYGGHNINEVDIKAVEKILRSDFITQGPSIIGFEKKLAKLCGARFAVSVCNGTAALHMAYIAAGIEAGDEVITTPNTFVATTNMLLVLGAKPVFCDIRLDTCNIDETKIEALITSKTRAIVPVHFAGQPCEMDTILKIAKKHSLLIIEDACHALGAEYKDKKIGNLKSDMTIFSFHPVKTITTGEGGAILTNNEVYYKKLLLLRSHGITKDQNGFNVMTEMGYNYRITDIQTALGTSQLTRLLKFHLARLNVLTQYQELLKDCTQIILPSTISDTVSSWHLYVIRVKDIKHRLPLYNFLKQAGIGVNFHYPAVYSHPYYRNNGYKNIFCTNADLYGETAITLPLHTLLKKKEVAFVSKKIYEYFA